MDDMSMFEEMCFEADRDPDDVLKALKNMDNEDWGRLT